MAKKLNKLEEEEALENYGGKGYSLEGRSGAEKLWLEACAMSDAIHDEQNEEFLFRRKSPFDRAFEIVKQD